MRYKVVGIVAVCLLLTGFLLYRFIHRYTLALQTVKDVPLSGGTNRFDYQSIDYARNLLFISHLGSKSVVVVDLASLQVKKTIQLSSAPYGILAIPGLKKVFV